jgi:hypothetical protein
MFLKNQLRDKFKLKCDGESNTRAGEFSIPCFDERRRESKFDALGVDL